MRVALIISEFSAHDSADLERMAWILGSDSFVVKVDTIFEKYLSIFTYLYMYTQCFKFVSSFIKVKTKHRYNQDRIKDVKIPGYVYGLRG